MSRAAALAAALLLAELARAASASRELRRLRGQDELQQEVGGAVGSHSRLGHGVTRILLEGRPPVITEVGVNRSSSAMLARTSRATIDAVGYARTFGAALADPDKEARDDFARRCKVVLSVRSHRTDLLPLDALRGFCETTDSPMECRIRLVGRLKQSYADGGSVWDFCISTYQWFQDKYGMRCPAQCEKLQCKATCEWLEAKKVVDARGKAIEGEQLKLDADDAAIQSLMKAKKEADQKLLDQSRTVEQAEVDLNRSGDKVNETARYRDEAEGKVAAQKEVTSRLEGDQSKLEKNIEVQESLLTESKFQLEFSTQNATHAANEVERLGKKMAEGGTRLGELEEEGANASALIEKLGAAVGNTSARLDEQGQQLEERNATVRKWEGETREAEEMLSKMNKSAEDLDQVQDLVEQQRGRLKEALDQASDTKRQIAREENVRASTQAALEQAKKHLGEVNERKKGLQGELEGLRGERVSATAESERIGNSTLKLSEDHRVKQQALAAEEEELAKVGRTLDFEGGVLAEEQAALDKAAASAAAAHEASRLAEDSLARQKQLLEESKAAVDMLQERIEEGTGAYEHGMEQLAEETDGYRNASARLLKSTPEIVHQHGLALLGFGAGGR